FLETYELALTFDTDPATAGEAVGYVLEMASGRAPNYPVEGILVSDMDPNLDQDEATIMLFTSGTHTVTGYATVDGEDLEVSTTLDVQASSAWTVDLQLDDLSLAAGRNLGWAVDVYDAFGNPIDNPSFDLTVDSDAITVGSDTLTSTVPGLYAATASSGDASDTEEFVVVPGDPDGIVLALSSTDLEIYQTATATVLVTDAYGNVTDDPWTIEVETEGLATTSWTNITFWEEGWYTVIATVDGTPLFDTVGPFLIDSTGPTMDITEPERGAWVYGEYGVVSGTVVDDWSALTQVTVNGEEITVESDGSFSTDVSYEFGTNLVESVATDEDGNTTTDLRAVLAGDFEPYGNGVADGLVVRIHEGEGGLALLEDMVVGLVDADALDDLIPSPVLSESGEDCYDLWFVEYCTYEYDLTLYAQNPSISSTDVTLDPQASGELVATMVANDIALDWYTYGDAEISSIIDVGLDLDGDITADSITIEMGVVPYVSGSTIYVDVSYLDVETANFYFDMDSSLYTVLSWLGLDSWISSTLESYIEDALEDALYDELPDTLEEILQDLEVGTTFEMNGAVYDLDALPYDFVVDDQGLTLSMETWFTAETWLIERTGEGSLYAGYTLPTWTGSPGTIMALGGDFLNQVFLALWGGGVLDMSTSGEELGLDVEDLELVFPGLTELNLEVEALLPPVILPGTGDGLLDMQIGDLHMTMYNGPAEEGYEMLEVYVSLFGEL
ncbi:MAG: hypothetical protein QGG40_14785, partial [Myxococcota bacterium]|nr:hypothetical protein [Myxococcota bacterium]